MTRRPPSPYGSRMTNRANPSDFPRLLSRKAGEGNDDVTRGIDEMSFCCSVLLPTKPHEGSESIINTQPNRHSIMDEDIDRWSYVLLNTRYYIKSLLRIQQITYIFYSLSASPRSHPQPHNWMTIHQPPSKETHPLGPGWYICSIVNGGNKKEKEITTKFAITTAYAC